MAQLVLTAASSAASIATKTGIGAFLARTAAATAASYVAGYADRLIFGPSKRKAEGPRLESFQVQASQEGASILRVYGRARVAGQLIWASNFKETSTETTESSGGKGARPSAQTTYKEYLYSASFAIGLCEGEISRLGRVWADGKLHDLSQYNTRLYKGDEAQMPDALLEAVQGAGAAPAYRGLAYIVFEDLPLKAFGNRIPQFSFEIEKSLKEEDPDALENQLTAVSLIPGSGEFVYGTSTVTRIVEEGVTRAENIHNAAGASDFTASIDALLDAAPNLAHVSLVVSWFGDSLDAGVCTLMPGVEVADKTTTPYAWAVGDTDRAGARLISLYNGAPAYGGTPADQSVLEAIAALKARGLKIMFHPFILMDAAGFPWRGRIGVGANDKTPAAASDIAAFFGQAARADFSTASGNVVYSGPAEWSFRRLILHYAHLCKLAGGVDAFLLGSELRGLTTARDSADNFPAIAAMKTLAADVRAVLGAGVEISYGADWSEYFGHQPADGSGDVYFHLDDLWSDPNIDFIGVDNYMPLADWRDGFAHLDAQAGAKSQYDVDYLKSNIDGGEGFDWFYANTADRDAQNRTPIADGSYGEPWVYRFKDLWSWWANAHHHRPGGVRAAATTSWVPQSKPIIFTETGCPAVDKGANQPNLFVDPKSSESALPYYSTGSRDDLAQRRALEAQAAFWADAAKNPVSSLYGGAMVDAARQYVWAYDARPFPDFPARSDVWGDVQNWEKGHWLNGRLGRAPLDLLVKALAGEVGFQSVETERLEGALTGYVVDRPMSAREMIDPLADVFQFDMIETGDAIRFQLRNAAPVAALAESALGAGERGAFQLSFRQAQDLPAAFRLGYLDEQDDFSPAVAEARDPGARPLREIGVEIAAVLPPAVAEARARSILADAWVMRETLDLAAPPSLLALEPGDAVTLDALGPDRRYRITQMEDGASRRLSLVRVAPTVYEAPVGPAAFPTPPPIEIAAAPLWELLDLPVLRDRQDEGAPFFAAFADPWPGGVALYRAVGENGAPALIGGATARAMMGRLATSLPTGAAGRWDNRSLEVSLSFGALAARSEEEVFAGANALVVESAAGGWEVLQFRDAQLQPGGAWRLSGLLRGQAGTEAEAAAGAAIGARIVLITPAVTQIDFSPSQRGVAYEWQAGPEKEIPDTANFTSRTLIIKARGQSPFSPAHLRARKEGGDIRLSWIRRTRIGGDSWEDEVPLSETFERYRLSIFDGPSEVRRLETTTPDYLYQSADITADFGAPGPGAAITFAVAQLSDAAGEGAEKAAAVIVV